MVKPAVSSLLQVLIERLQAREGLELEVKSARGGLPQDLWPTVSAFANTQGGWILLGVREQDQRLLVEGIPDASTVLQRFHDLQRNTQKVSTSLCGATDAAIEHADGKDVIVLRVPAAARRDRPVYVNGNPYTGTYVRRHAGDYQCSKPEVDRMMREASDQTADSAILPGFSTNDLDPAALQNYRRRFQLQHPSDPRAAYDDQHFLFAIGALRRDRQRAEEGLTAAGLLLLGRAEAIRDWRSRHLIDFRLLPDDPDTDQRWEDRVAREGNLLGAFEAIYPRLVAGQPVPFHLEGGVRAAEGPAHEVLREALVNLLVHADYAELQPSLVFRSPDGFRLRNPGSSRVTEIDLFTGDRSDPRNVLLVRMFRFIGLAEEAGSGMPKIIRRWRELGFVLPEVDVGTERYEFTLSLRHTHFLAQDDRLWLQSFADNWPEAEQLALVKACHDGGIDNVTLRRLTGQHPADITKVLGSLRDRGFLEMSGWGRGAHYQLGPVAREALEAQEGTATGETEGSRKSRSGGSAENSGGKEPDSGGSGADSGGSASIQSAEGTRVNLEKVAREARQHPRLPPAQLAEIVVALCAIQPLALGELARLIGRNVDYTRTVTRKLLEEGRLFYLFPGRPNHPRQKYAAKKGISQLLLDDDASGEEPAF